MTKLFVCYHAVTALTERFCQNAFAPEGDGGRVHACPLQVQLAGPTCKPNSAADQLLLLDHGVRRTPCIEEGRKGESLNALIVARRRCRSPPPGMRGPDLPVPQRSPEVGADILRGAARVVETKCLRIPLPLAQLKGATAMVLKSDKAGFFRISPVAQILSECAVYSSGCSGRLRILDFDPGFRRP
jgi:hypothetical protein